ncbi:MAG: LLM class flavin-dependent oxidoreductase [Candidatus Eremiobacteraeota bacterium]|nr:LLM class flavin-dependent oxidoreductase [Candidatus Eremiobacteraeota bacterium]
MHLNVMTQCSPSPQFEGLWRDPNDRTSVGYRSLEYWTSVAHKLEGACIDALFFADIHGIYDVYENSWAPALRYAVQAPSIDPVLVVPALAAATRRLGLAVTYSTTYHPPYECARLFSSLDHLTGGRIGWNIVTSYLQSAAGNGLCEYLGHDERYDRADEYVAVCRALWEESWESGAVVRDAANATFTDPERVHEIDFKGRWFAVRGPHQCEPSPQRTPVLYQAGGSKRGMVFAAKHAEVVFVTLPDPVTGAEYLRELRRHAASMGRDPARVKTLQAAFVLAGATRGDVRARIEQFAAFTSPDGEIAKFCAWIGFNIAAYPNDLPIDDIPIEASRSIRDFLQRYDPGRAWTVADLRSIALLSRHPHKRTGWLLGTPEQIADQMEEYVARTGVDGFNLIPCPPSSGIADICDLIVPELQRRGVFRREYGAPGETLRERYFGAGCEAYA